MHLPDRYPLEPPLAPVFCTVPGCGVSQRSSRAGSCTSVREQCGSEYIFTRVSNPSVLCIAPFLVFWIPRCIVHSSYFDVELNARCGVSTNDVLSAAHDSGAFRLCLPTRGS
jgi:hypothetical protein